MALPTLDDLTTPPTATEFKASIYATIAALGVNTTLWKPGAVVRAMISAFAILLAACAALVSALAKMRFVGTATGDWLTQVAHYDYGLDRREATLAETYCTFTNIGGAEFDEAAGDVLVSNPATGKVYQAAALILAAWSGTGPYPTASVLVTALEEGTGSNSAPGTITNMVTALLGVTVTNPTAAVALDEESDEELTAECQDKRDGASVNGPTGAYEWAAMRKGFRIDWTLVPVTSVQTSPPVGDNTVTVTVSGPDGSITGTYTDPATDLGAVHQGIQLWAVPIGITEVTQTATTLTVAVTYSVVLWSASTLSDAELDSAVGVELASFFASQPVGGWSDGSTGHWVYLEGIKQAVAKADPHIINVTLALPAADVAVTTGQKPTLGTVIQGTVTRV
jgi:hypothetical protein